MTTKPVSVQRHDKIQDACRLMDENHVGALLVKEGDTPLGIITEQDIVRSFVAQGINPLDKNVADFQMKELITIRPDNDIYDALVEMRDYNIRHLPVVENNELIGLLTIKDILKIEPQLFDLLVEKFEIMEEDRKRKSVEQVNESQEGLTKEEL